MGHHIKLNRIKPTYYIEINMNQLRRRLGSTLMIVSVVLMVGCASSSDSASNADKISTASYESLTTGNYAAGERQLRQALAAKPSDPWALLNLGALMHKTGRYEQAAAYYKRVIEIDPNGEISGRSQKASVPGYENRTAAELAQDNMDNLPTTGVRR